MPPSFAPTIRGEVHFSRPPPPAPTPTHPLFPPPEPGLFLLASGTTLFSEAPAAAASIFDEPPGSLDRSCSVGPALASSTAPPTRATSPPRRDARWNKCHFGTRPIRPACRLRPVRR